MRLFREAPESMFTPQRAAELQAFAQKAEAFDKTLGCNSDYLVDMLSVNYSFWGKFLLENKGKGRNPLVESSGNLDVLAACVVDGVEGKLDWGKVSGSDYSNLQYDLSRCGLHSLHFRMGLNDPTDRLHHTMALALAIYRVAEKSFRKYLNPLMGQSVLHRRDVLAGYIADESSGDKLLIGAHSGFFLASGQDLTGADEFKRLLMRLLLKRNESLADVDRHSLAMKIEGAFLPLVYNYGYRLKAEGLSNEVVCQKASAHIDSLLEILAMERATHNALKRQVLINLFSAFPDGLAMLSAKPEELQGVILDPALIDSDDANFFAKTLGGPLRNFAAIDSVKPTSRCAQIITFLETSGYPLTFEVAARGSLINSRSIFELFSNSHPNGHSVFLEQTLTGEQPPLAINDSLLLYLSVPQRLALYSDPALMKIVDRTLEFFRKQQEISTGKDLLTMGFYSIGGILKDRPHLQEAVLERLVEQSLLKPKVFDWCGFGHRELKSLGKLAPQELKSHVLESALGL
jgi:hypothetical protein